MLTQGPEWTLVLWDQRSHSFLCAFKPTNGELPFIYIYIYMYEYMYRSAARHAREPVQSQIGLQFETGSNNACLCSFQSGAIANPRPPNPVAMYTCVHLRGRVQEELSTGEGGRS